MCMNNIYPFPTAEFDDRRAERARERRVVDEPVRDRVGAQGELTASVGYGLPGDHPSEGIGRRLIAMGRLRENGEAHATSREGAEVVGDRPFETTETVLWCDGATGDNNMQWRVAAHQRTRVRRLMTSS
jgi:hypothetical protein